MKYIKTYENIDTIEEGLKKYVICKNYDIYIVLEILNYLSFSLINAQRITFNIGGITIGDKYTTSVKGTKDRMVFQSDNIDDIRNQLELLLYTKKYNL
jgi:hypothetical protein